jgi:hypothetical protein
MSLVGSQRSPLLVRNVTTQDDVDDFLMERSALVLVREQGCTFCEKFQPIFEAVARLRNEPFYEVEILFANENKIKLPFEVPGYPTVVLLHFGRVADMQKGLVSQDDFEKFADEAVLPDELLRDKADTFQAAQTLQQMRR